MKSGWFSENGYLYLLVVLVITGLVMQWGGVVDWQAWLAYFKEHAQSGWLMMALVIVQIVLYMFALPGSALLWVVAPLYALPPAMMILVAGSTLGALAAYWLARRARSAKLEQLRMRSGFQAIQRHGDLITLLALRIFPSIPHSLINYSAGILHLPLTRFVLATVIGFTIKVYVYVEAIHGLTEVSKPSQLANIDIVAPLLVLVLLVLVAKSLQYFWMKKGH